VTELVLASGPLRYLGGSIETFALPYGAFIVIAWVLFYLYRRPHSVPRLKYLRPAHQTALGTREPGTTGLIAVAKAETRVPGGQLPHAAETRQPSATHVVEEPVAPAAGDQPEGDA